MTKKFSLKKLAPHAGRVAIIIAVLFLTIYMITVLTASSDFYAESAKQNAKIYFDEDMVHASELAEYHYGELYKLVDKMEFAKSKEQVDKVIETYIGSEQFGDLRYYSQGKSYSPMGDEIENELSAPELISALSKSKNACCSPVYFDERAQVDCVAFFVPVRGSAYVDGVLSIVPAKNIISVGTVLNEKTSVVAILDENGKIYSSIQSEQFPANVGADFTDFVKSFTGDKGMIDAVRQVLDADKLASTEIEATGIRYTVVAQPIDVFDGHLSLLTLSVSDTLITDELAYIRHFTNILILALIAFAVGLVYAFLFQKKAKEAVSTANLSDSTLECSNTEGFRRKAINISYNSGERFAIAVLSIRNFHFVDNQLGSDASVEVLKFISHVFSTLSSSREAFGYAGDGKFLLLINYTTERAFRDKLLVMENVINKYDALMSNNIKLKIVAGICLGFGGKRRTIPEMIDCATIACEEARADVKMSYMIYTDTVRDKITRNEQIEAQMETALENNDFRLFLQPKYNVKEDCVDSAEALVRWFDPKKGDYIFPAEFISLFEANGFIVKMDHYIYLEVLKYLSAALERGEKVIPISVNVSRVTAISPDFVNFYVGNKKKYQIEEDLITLEFTESFAVEDYSKLAEIVNALHEDGIRCSVDDFGVGYSSFSILKELSMDELKLDRLFLTPGVNAKRDEKIIKTIVDLAKDMGMSVVQEGVENKEMFDRVVEMGVGIVQGYYYAKAIPLEDFRIFIKSNTSIRYKAVVK